MGECGDDEGRISAEIPDWNREQPRGFWDPGRKLLLAIRKYQDLGRNAGAFAALARKCLVFRHRFWSVVTGADIPLNCNIGGGLLLNHPNGIVIHPAARIGVNCLISQQVTVGATEKMGLPEIGGHVDIGAGAKILGPVRVGDHARIGANAVVVNDVPGGATAIGVPASVNSVGEDAKRNAMSS
jgi:serine O-acetyltransferase